MNFCRPSGPIPAGMAEQGPQDIKKLTDREVDVMMALWQSGKEAVSTGELLQRLRLPGKNPLQSLQVVMRGLRRKDAVAVEKKKQTNLYRALLSQEAYRDFAIENFVQHHYHGSKTAFAISLLRRADLDETERGTLLALLEPI